ncbi:MAG: hypothetical protein GY904_16630, partial [Planctomycetaceae bacterium]|nr:hypothetical protein [Planctomycetaceae bacterium]
MKINHSLPKSARPLARRNSHTAHSQSKASRRRRLRVECLEDRRLLAAEEPHFIWAIEGMENAASSASNDSGLIRFKHECDHTLPPDKFGWSCTDPTIEKVSPSGEVKWAEQIIGKASISDTATTPDGATIVAGYFLNTAQFGSITLNTGSSLTGHLEQYARRGYVARVSSEGSFEWATPIAQVEWHQSAISAVAVKSDGTIVVAGDYVARAENGVFKLGGSTLPPSPEIDYEVSYGFTASLNAEGTFTKAHGFTEWSAGYETLLREFQLEETAGGQVVLVGRYGALRVRIGGRLLSQLGLGDHVFHARLNDDLSLSNVITGQVGEFGAFDMDFKSFSTSPNGTALISGHFECQADFNPFELTDSTYNNNCREADGIAFHRTAFAASVSLAGQFTWALQGPEIILTDEEIWGATPKYDRGGQSFGFHSAILEDGSKLVGAEFRNSYTFNEHVLTTVGEMDSFLAKIDSDGNTVWIEHIGTPGDDFISDILYSGDAAYVNLELGGTTSLGSITLNSGTHLVKIDPNYTPNTPPTLDSIANLTIDEDAAEQIVNLAGISAGGGETQPIRVTATSGNAGLI